MSSTSQVLELHMRSISIYVKKPQLEAALSAILHAPSGPFAACSSAHGPLNFVVYLFKDTHNRGRPHNGQGSLTLRHDAGTIFMQQYGDRPEPAESPPNILQVGGRRIQFTISRRKAHPDVVDRIIRFPYSDPAVVAQKEATSAIFRTDDVTVNTIQFGWWCRDSVFSAEWEARVNGTLKVNEERREFRLEIANGLEPLFVVIRFSRILHVSSYFELSADAPGIVFFHLSDPPNFESGVAGDLRALRKRLSYLPLNNHERVAAFTSLELRLVCNSAHDFDRFRRIVAAAKVRNVLDTEIRLERRGLFAPAILQELTSQIAKQLRWTVAFQVEALWRNANLDPTELLLLIPRIRALIERHGRTHTTAFLCHFGNKARYWSLFTPNAAQTVQELFDTEHMSFLKKPAIQPLRPDNSNTFEALHVIVTPTSLLLEGPYPEVSNRVMRGFEAKHHESFLRVSFVDEGQMQYRFDRELDCVAFTHQRVGTVLKQGLVVAGRRFEYLAYSQSALKEHAVWFVRPFRREATLVNAASIIKSLGRFDKLSFDPTLIRCPARYAARISQAFTSTSSTTVEVEEIIHEQDISTGTYHFTDGVGTMSLELATDIWKQLSATRRRRRTKAVPRSYQVRFQGCKGMLSVDYKLKGHVIGLRPSMIKFDAPHTRVVEIARAFDRPGVYYLNRPLIMLMEGLGVCYEVFKKYQDIAVKKAHESANSLTKFADFLETHGLGASYKLPSILTNLHDLGVSLEQDKFYRKILQFSQHHVLRTIKNKARIPIPDACTLVGVADVHKYLPPGHIFVCTRALDSNKLEYMQGDVLISRSPTIHPGDVQIAKAIGKPPPGSPFEREPLPNTVVFSVLGDRPLPSCLGGGDLDGDVYNLLPLSKLPSFRPKRIFQAAEYPPAERNLLDRPSTTNDVCDFIVDYINSDTLGITATNWLLIADQADKGILHPDCLKLAALHSMAVDYPKTGKPVPIHSIPKPPSKSMPDWHAPEIATNSKDHYPSNRAIGKLFRAIKLPEVRESSGTLSSFERGLIRSGQMPAPDISDLADALEDLDLGEHPLLGVIWEQIGTYLSVREYPEQWGNDMVELFKHYCSELQGLCATHTLSHAKAGVLLEEEAVVGTMLAKTSQPRKRQDLIASLREKTDFLVRGVKDAIMGDDEECSWEDSLLRGWLAFELGIAEQRKGEFGSQSFMWIALGTIFEAVKELDDEAKVSRGRGNR
uniref:RNA-dependent RNA polymerase n=1 Tax=Mycena chlorophos TaxID=658473 RepID=A0ABQ0LF90_MYCCL|nr:predicted protein [Mycena chlorophos]